MLKSDLWHCRCCAFCLCRLTHQGLVLEEVAPGIDLERQVLALMDFKPLVAHPVRTMDTLIFTRG